MNFKAVCHHYLFTSTSQMYLCDSQVFSIVILNFELHFVLQFCRNIIWLQARNVIRLQMCVCVHLCVFVCVCVCVCVC